MNENLRRRLDSAIEELKKSPETLEAIHRYQKDQEERFGRSYALSLPLELANVMNNEVYCNKSCNKALLGELSTLLREAQIENLQVSVELTNFLMKRPKFYEVIDSIITIFKGK